jgi:hypothetical protein
MTLRGAIRDFLQQPGDEQKAFDRRSLNLLADYFSPSTDFPLTEIDARRLRDFLARWYVEKTAAVEEVESPRTSGAEALLDSLTRFFSWVDSAEGPALARELLPIIRELGETLPRALKITRELAACVRERGGQFHFPEFLTSFEEGGRSRYDIDDYDQGAQASTREGYFRILRAEGVLFEAVDTVSESRVWPIIFPERVAPLLAPDYIIDLQLVRGPEGWQVADCGFAYPPGAEV